MEKTINEVFKNRVDKYKDRLAVEKKRDGKWTSASWNEYYDNSRAAGLGLHSLGVKKGDRISILSENCLEWLYSDMGALGLGACVVPIYPTLTKEEVVYYIENSDSKIIIVENSLQFEKALFAKEKCPTLEKIIIINEEGANINQPLVMNFNDLIKLGREKHKENNKLFEEFSEKVGPDDILSIIYTSGTTGLPKGVVLTHSNIMAILHSLHEVDPPYATDADHTSPFLPLSHIYGRITNHFMGIFEAIKCSYVDKIETIIDDILEIRPTMLMAFPRVLEKVYYKILMQVEEQSKIKQKIFYWGQKVGEEVSSLREKKEKRPLALSLKYGLAYRLIFKKLRDALGGRIRYITASGAPTARQIQLFFNAAGIKVVEGYGMTEVTGPATMSNLDNYTIGTVGPVISCIDVKIADDGEILVKGGNVFKGYWKMEEETRKTLTEDGYFKTGDIGEFDGSGFLKITDRKKDLIITAGGKNIAPQKIETIFKNDPLFSMFTVIGEGKRYLTALCNINLEHAELKAKEKKISFENPDELFDNQDFLKLVDQHVEELNAQLARFETIKYYRIIKNEFTPESGELTNSFKVKRKVVEERYQDVIKSMYS